MKPLESIEIEDALTEINIALQRARIADQFLLEELDVLSNKREDHCRDSKYFVMADIVYDYVLQALKKSEETELLLQKRRIAQKEEEKNEPNPNFQ